MRNKISRKGWLLMGVTVGLLVLVFVVGTALAQGPGGDEPQPPVERVEGMEPASPSGGPGYNRSFTYQGYLEEDGAPADGLYDLWFDLWTGETGGSFVAHCLSLALTEFYGVSVEGGFFTASMICGTSNSEVFNGDNLWLQPWVQPAGAGTWTDLPRQPFTSVPYAFSLIPGAIVQGAVASPSAALSVTQTYDASPAESAYGIYGRGPDVGVYGGGDHYGVHGHSGYIGVYGWSDGPTGAGVYGYATRAGVEGVGYYGVVADGYIAIRGQSNDGNLIELYDGNPYNRRFYVDNVGNVYADGGYRCGNNVNDNDASGDLNETELEPCLYDNWAADFAEVLPAAGELEPGDVLVIGADGQLARSDTPYAASVMGVYSTRPSYVGGAQFLDQDGYAPLAVMGVVPVKASAENGPIVPGDLLTTSSTPGHAMRCEGVELCFGRTIGKALEGLDAGTGTIQILVILQ